MRNDRTHTAKRPAAKDHPKAEARLDRTRAVEEVKRFLDLALRELHLEIAYDISGPPGGQNDHDEADVVVAFHGADQDFLLERNAELLLALEYLAHRWMRLDPRLHDRVRFDCGDYRAVRLEELKLSARVAAQRVRETGQPFTFNPMSPRDRRIIHLELGGAAGVRTVSEDIGDRRHLVIYPITNK